MKLRYLFVGILVTALFQTAWVGKMITDRAAILRSGTEVRLETGFVDPRDLFRGHYVTLNLLASRVRKGDLEAVELPDSGEPIWMTLRQDDDGFWRPVSVFSEPPPFGIALRGTFEMIWNGDGITLDFPFDRYFAPKARALELEDLRNDQRLGIVLAVMPDGTAAVKGIVIDGKPIYDEPLY